VASADRLPTPSFDRRLVHLPLAFDLQSVATSFERHWEAGASSRSPIPSIQARALHDVKYEPEVRCVCTYELLLGAPDGTRVRTMGVLEIRPDGIYPAFLEEDSELVWLEEALDPQSMQRRFERSPRLHNSVTSPPKITVLRYKPRARCAFRFDLPTRGGEETVFGKMLVRGAEEMMAAVSTLHAQSLERDEMPHIAPPLDHWPDIHLVLQRAVQGGEELHAVVFDERGDHGVRDRWMHAAGERLAGLHAFARAPGPTRSLEADTEELFGYAPAIAAPDPALSQAYVREVERVHACANEHRTRSVASHGAFRTDQFMIQDASLVMIDLDGYCWAEPARDIGNLFAYLEWRRIRQPRHAKFIDGARRHFLAGYAAVTEPPVERRVAIFEAASMLKIAGRRYRSLTFREWPLVPALVDGAAVLLGG
jgi:hypothetical protein